MRYWLEHSKTKFHPNPNKIYHMDYCKGKWYLTRWICLNQAIWYCTRKTALTWTQVIIIIVVKKIYPSLLKLKLSFSCWTVGPIVSVAAIRQATCRLESTSLWSPNVALTVPPKAVNGSLSQSQSTANTQPCTVVGSWWQHLKPISLLRELEEEYSFLMVTKTWSFSGSLKLLPNISSAKDARR